MSLLPIHLYGDPILRKRAREVKEIDSDLRQLSVDMLETMVVSDGAGLAANQVGDLRRVIVVNFTVEDGSEDLRVLINPDITMRDGLMRIVEGCLSLPEINEEVERAASVKVDYMNLDGECSTTEVSGLLSAVLQHEIDHLEGILFIDRISSIRRKLLKGALKRIERISKQPV